MNTKELIKEQKVLDTTINRIKDQTYFITELLEKKKENMKTGNTASGDNIAYRRGARDQQLLKGLRMNLILDVLILFQMRRAPKPFI